MFCCEDVFFRRGSSLGFWFRFSGIPFGCHMCPLAAEYGNRIDLEFKQAYEASRDLNFLMHSMYDIEALRMWMAQIMDIKFWKLQHIFRLTRVMRMLNLLYSEYRFLWDKDVWFKDE